MVEGEKFNKVRELLRKIFQFEDSDLDFGIYRIMNLKKKEIEKFIDKDLKEEIDKEFSNLMSSKEANLGDERDKLKAQIKNTFGDDINSIVENPQFKETPLIKRFLEIESQLKQEVEIESKEDQIYDSILSFFSRYYDEGDFISKRRYSNNEKYAIPYNGEEVYLHWANNDQYYVKTSEDFNFYKFKAGSVNVEFKISAEEVEISKNNNKSSGNRYFVINSESTTFEENNLELFFGFRELTIEEESNILEFINKELDDKKKKKKLTQELINDYNVSEIHKFTKLRGLNQLDQKEEKSTSGKTILEYHLNKYTKKNTSDYFIHKDLGKFLSRELDFYIKNEMFRIDDVLNNESGLKLDLNKISVFKSISLKIINFLSQIEDFQKKLFEKKKFVVENEYCLTIDNVDEKYYSKILENKDQLKEWVKLGFVEKVEKVNLEFLKNNPTLVLDTKFFGEDFKYDVLSSIDDLEEKTNGLLINSENFQALNLLQDKYKEKVQTTYIDPPYNTGGDGFLYKDGFSHSSWLSMMENRLLLSKDLLDEKGILFSSIGDNEFLNLNNLKRNIFGENNYLSNLIWKKKQGGGNDSKNLVIEHEYLPVYVKNIEQFEMKLDSSHNLSDDLYPYSDEEGDYGLVTLDKSSIRFSESLVFEIKDKEGNTYLPRVVKGKQSCWRWGKKKVEEEYDKLVFKNGKVYTKYYRPKGVTPKSLLFDSRFGRTEVGKEEIKNLFHNSDFVYPKPTGLIKHCVLISTNKDSLILDFFAGSGTTGHAVLNLNKEDEGNRKYILVEMGEYFDSVTKPRIQKVIFSQNWKDGKPTDNDGSTKHIFKYQKLEQYEDTLNNIDFKEQPSLIQESKDYHIKYMLEFESKENNVFLNLDGLDDPFNYKIDMFNQDNEKVETKVDLIETFNYIAGIEVKKINVKENKGRKYIIVKGSRNDNSIIVIWRNKKDNFNPQEDKDFIEKEILIDEQFDEIYTNGSSSVKDAKVLDEIFKSKLFN